MSVPPTVLSGAETALEQHTGSAVSLRHAGSIGGGCINPSARLESDRGENFFLKWNDAADANMFPAEADGLAALAQSRALRVPEVMGWGGESTRDDPGWLLLEYIPPGSPGPDYGHRLGAGLAALHDGRVAEGSAGGTAQPYGWHRDNFIGSLPQENGTADGWAAFWRDNRIEPQVRLARNRGFFAGGSGRVLEDLMVRMEEVLPSEAESGAAPVHGDLWSGNYYPDSQGSPVLIDPAVYRGEGEVDLAMMELFGSFPSGFRESYGEARGIPPEYEVYRRDLYQLFYLLVHVNLFGGSYVRGSLTAAKRVLAAVRP